jgi:hypothetical protein
MADLTEYLTHIKARGENMTRCLFLALYPSCDWTYDIGILSEDQKYVSYTL